MTRTFPRSPALFLLAGVLGLVLLQGALAEEPSAGGDRPPVQLFATGLVGNAALTVDPEGALLATNYRLPGTVGRISTLLGASLLWEVDRSEMPESAPPLLVGVALDDDRRMLALDSTRGRLLRWNPETEATQILADRYQGRRFDSLFAVAVDPWGNIYFSEPERTGGQGSNGAVYRFDVSTNRTSQLVGERAQPTGLCLSFEGRQLFFAESGAARIVVVNLEADPVDPQGRSIALPALLGLDDAEEVGRIGHLTTDRRGWLYAALWDRGEVAVIDPQEGTLLEVIPSGGRKVFGLALRHDALLMSIPEKEAIYSYDLRPLISRHAP